ncbi:MAG: ABC transporter permease, partial [Burkholderiaceae bacterium]|nr:ABC transporter permease [Burkholderiaceae bacterium]
MTALEGLARLGRATRGQLAEVGAGTRLFMQVLARTPQALMRFGLVREQVYFLGNRSLSIIGVSGLFVGFVLALQGYYTLQRYGSAEAVGLLVAL